MNRDSFPARLLLIAVLLHAAAFAYSCIYGQIYLKDSWEYLYQAWNLLEYSSWYAWDIMAPVRLDYFTFRPPLYALVIGLAHQLWNNNLAVILLQQVLSVFNVMLVYRLCRMLGVGSRRLDVFLIVCLVLFPTQVVLANLIMTDLLFQTLVLLAFYAVLRLLREYKPEFAILLGFCLSALLFTKPVSLGLGLVLLPICVFWMIRQKQFRRKGHLLLFPALLTGLSFHWICEHNEKQTGAYHYSSMKAYHQYKYHARYVLTNRFDEETGERWTDQTTRRASRESHYADRLTLMQQAGDSVLMLYPVTFLKLYLKGCAAFFLDPGRYDLVAWLNMAPDDFNGLLYELNAKGISAVPEMIRKAPVLLIVYLLLILIWNSYCFLLLVRFIVSRKPELLTKLLLLAFIFYLCLATGMIGVARYRTAVFPELLLVWSYVFFELRRNKEQTQTT